MAKAIEKAMEMDTRELRAFLKECDDPELVEQIRLLRLRQSRLRYRAAHHAEELERQRQWYISATYKMSAAEREKLREKWREAKRRQRA